MLEFSNPRKWKFACNRYNIRVLAILGVTRGTQAKPLGGSETLAKISFSVLPEAQKGKFASFQVDVEKTENWLLTPAKAGCRKGVQFEVRKWYVVLNFKKFTLSKPLKNKGFSTLQGRLRVLRW